MHPSTEVMLNHIGSALEVDWFPRGKRKLPEGIKRVILGAWSRTTSDTIQKFSNPIRELR